MAKTSSLIITPALLADAPEILGLQKLAYQSEAALNGDYTLPSLTQTRPELEADFQRQVYLKATRDGTIVGAVRSYEQNGTCFIGRLIATPTARSAFQRRPTLLKHAVPNLLGEIGHGTNSSPANAARATCTYIRSWAIIRFWWESTSPVRTNCLACSWMPDGSARA